MPNYPIVGLNHIFQRIIVHNPLPAILTKTGGALGVSAKLVYGFGQSGP